MLSRSLSCLLHDGFHSCLFLYSCMLRGSVGHVSCLNINWNSLFYICNNLHAAKWNKVPNSIWHVKRCIIRFIYVTILSFLFVFTKGLLLFYHCILLLYILSISIQCPFISIVYFSIYIYILSFVFINISLLFYLLYFY